MDSGPPPKRLRRSASTEKSWRPGAAGSAAFAWFAWFAACGRLALVLVLAWGAAAQATEAPLASANPELEAQVMRIATELRCLVCQNQTIADSNADLAVDLRQQVREQLQQGRSQAQILDYMTARYGDFVLYRPPLKSTTALLWFGPGLLLVGGLATLGWILVRRSRLSADRFESDADAELTDSPVSIAPRNPP